MYDPATNTWTATASMTHARQAHTATALQSGRVLVAGGLGMGLVAGAEVYLSGPLGSPCAVATDCESGFCADGVCCDTACNAGPCDACAVAAGAAVNGTCALLTGPTCDDGDACTQTDTCQAGVCAGANPLTCAPQDECHTNGVCDPANGNCSNPPKPDGAACSTGTCEGGVCTPVDGGGTSSASASSSSASASASSTTSSGASASSSSSAASSSGSGSGGAGGAGGGDEENGGCGCRLAGAKDWPSGPGGLSALALAAACLRRRRRAPSSIVLGASPRPLLSSAPSPCARSASPARSPSP